MTPDAIPLDPMKVEVPDDPALDAFDAYPVEYQLADDDDQPDEDGTP